MSTLSFMQANRIKENGERTIFLSIRKSKERILISTGICCQVGNFDPHTLIDKTQPNFRAKNAKLSQMKNAVELLLLSGADTIPLKKLKPLVLEVLNLSPQVTKDFLYYFDEFVQMKSNSGTKSVYLGTRRKIEAYDKHCTLDSIDRKWLTLFEAHMAETMKINAYAIHLRNIRAIFNYGIDEGATTNYPFRKFKIKREETHKRALSIDQLKEFKDYPCEPHQERYRDLFLLSFYLLGMNIGDLLLLTKDNVVNGRIDYYRRKTRKLYSIKIEPEAQEIIDKYPGKSYLLNVMDDYANYRDFVSRINKALKKIGDFNLSTYWARHTWASIAAGIDTPKETISEALGHEIGSSVTSIYISFDKRKIDTANRAVIDTLF